MPGLLPDVDPDGLLEFSVVYTDRALNHMSAKFGGVMRDIATTLKQAYGGASAVVVPGGGTFGMEAVARQFATAQNVLVLRNGWFSYRWSQIFEAGSIPASARVLKARRVGTGPQAPFAPAPLSEVLETIERERPAVVFAPHVETASGMLLPDDYVRAVGAAVHSVNGLFVLDCIASGAIWVDMPSAGVDVLLSAPQKSWSGSPGCAFVMLSPRARERIEHTTSTSFACNLRQWLQITETYESGKHAYYATLPTDTLSRARDVMLETALLGFNVARAAQQKLGNEVRQLLSAYGYPSVAALGFEAPGVVVSFTDDPEIQSSRKLAGVGLQTAAGVPLQCDEGPDFRSWRIGLFGLDKLKNTERTLSQLDDALRRIR